MIGSSVKPNWSDGDDPPRDRWDKAWYVVLIAVFLITIVMSAGSAIR